MKGLLFKFSSNILPTLFLAGVVVSAVAVAPIASGVESESEEAATREFIRQQQQGRAIREQMEKKADIHLDPGVLSEQILIPAESRCFNIKKIQLAGSGADFFQKTLKKVLKNPDRAEGRCLGVNGINIVVSRLQNELIAQGYVTSRVYIGEQDLSSGVLVLTTVVGKISNIYLAEDTSSFVFKWNSIPPFKEQVLNLRYIEQALENLKRVPTADADIAIYPANNGSAGESDLAISYQQDFPLRFALSVDDAGSKATGKYQGNATLSIDNPLRLSDLFYFSFSHDLGGGDSGRRGNESKIAHYSVPYRFWQVAITANESDYYQSVAGLTETYIYSGRSKLAELSVSRLVWRSMRSKLTLSMQAHQKKSWNYIDDTEVEVQRRIASGWSAGANYRTRFGSIIWDSNLRFKRGTGAFGAIRAPEEEYGEGTTRYEIVTADSYLSIPLSFFEQNFRYSSTVRIQQNLTNLLPQERFSIGGRYTVRGFDGESTLMGDKGFLLRNEMGWILSGHYKEPYLGLDAGRVSGHSTQYLRGKTLVGAVIGFKGAWKNLNYDVFYGTYLHKPERMTSDQPMGFSLNYSF